MSRWRQKGFVLDSDEEEEDESQIESQKLWTDSEGRVERVESDEEEVGKEIEIAETANILEEGGRTTSENFGSTQHPQPSPYEPSHIFVSPRERTESPDPLQSSSTPKSKRIRLAEPTSPLLLHTVHRVPPIRDTASNGDANILSQTSCSTRTLSHPITEENPSERVNVFDVLGGFGIAPLSDDSEDESLSDPPTDLESPPPVSISPHRQTAVQIVIPSSTVLQNSLAEHHRARDFRQRKPIQLHPYVLEGEIYRREVQSRGLQPVPRQRSPERQPRIDNETQEKEFDPNESPSSSPPENEIPVSTPVIQRSRKDALAAISARRPKANGLRQDPSTRLHFPHKAKKNISHIASTQTAVVQRSIFDNDVAPPNTWSIPPNSPPFSSSPPISRIESARLTRRQHTTPIDPNLPTPSTSSVFHDDLQVQGSDSEPIAHTARKSATKLRQISRIVLSESESSASESSSELEQSDTELKVVGKKIKGVLPASWLRFDREAQEERKAKAREKERARLDATNSSEQIEPQRGVAKKIAKRIGRPLGASSAPVSFQDVVTISDESDDEPGMPVMDRDVRMQNSIEDAIVWADILDTRYADDNLSDMENDRLHLPTLGGTRSKRKRQTKVTDTFGKTKRVKMREGDTPGIGIRRRLHEVSVRKSKHRSRPRQSPLPAMSIVDVDLSAEDTGSCPQFLKIARRQALRRPDLARQSLSSKQIRLHSARDTEDANIALLQWRQGSLKPKATVNSASHDQRHVLADKVDNQQHAGSRQTVRNSSTKEFERNLDSENKSSPSRQSSDLPSGLRIFQRTSSHKKTSRNKQSISKPSKDISHLFNRALPSFRTAQLEDDEKRLGRTQARTSFHTGLQRIDRQFGALQSTGQSHENPVLARFLAEENAASIPTASKDNGRALSGSNISKSMPTSKRRLVRKSKPHRVDIDAREYRQPSEPAIEEILRHSIAAPEGKTTLECDQSSLQGLGPYGTRYPTTFDVYSLVHGTYFHSSTFIGSDEFQRALIGTKARGRDLSDFAGYFTITHDAISVRCGPWNDQTYSGIRDLMKTIWKTSADQVQIGGQMTAQHTESIEHSVKYLRSLITYVTVHLSFLDLIDRMDFVAKMHNLIKELLDRLLMAYATVGQDSFTSVDSRKCIRVMSYLLVLGLQIHQLAQDESVLSTQSTKLMGIIESLSRTIISHLTQHGVSELSTFLETNKRHQVRVNGIQETDILVESTVICMHILECIAQPRISFWSMVSQDLQSRVTEARHVHIFECTWATHFTFLPFVDIDRVGIPTRHRKLSFQGDDWTCIKDLLRRLFDLYPNTSGMHSNSINDYVRAALARCHRLIYHWHWRRPEQMLNVVFDFFGKNGLRQLQRESSLGSVSYLEDLASDPSLALLPNETAFHIALKCLALGLQGMRDSYPEKKIRSFVFRTIPNHGRMYPKDQPLDEESLAELRNHHDLLCTLYWAAPPSCRPKLDHIRHLVSHESSHREACRLNVRAWANLTTFQLSTDEHSTSATPFSLWLKDIISQTLKQYRIAKTEADEYLESVLPGDKLGVATIMVRQTVEKNQEQVIATLRDCITGMRKAIQHAKDKPSLKAFLTNTDVVHLLELPHLEDHRLVSVIRDTLNFLREYAMGQETLSSTGAEQQQTNEDSQDYGEFPDLDEFEDVSAQPLTVTARQANLDFIQLPLWHLLSNAFGAESLPDENLLMDCVDAWISFAKSTIESGEKTWSYYIESFSQVSWQQLRPTEQTRKFGPYFMAAVIGTDAAAFKEHQHDFVKALLLSLVERESMLRFQSRLLHAIIRTDHEHPLVKNLPFSRDPKTGIWDVTAETVEARRLCLISSILSNIRDDVQVTPSSDATYALETRRRYAALLKEFMTAMKNNYQELKQGTVVTGAYVEFVQQIIQFLKQYTNEICPVLPFFTDSVAFPLPAADPTYIIGRLSGYASRTTDSGATKQLSVFMQTVAQQAAADNHHLYLVNQLKTSLCTDEGPAADKAALRSVLLQGVFPAYLEAMFSSRIAFVIARPIMLCLPSILDKLIFDLRVTQPSTVWSVVRSVMSISHIFIRNIDHWKDDPILFNERHALFALAHMLKAMTVNISLLEHISSWAGGQCVAKKLPIIRYMESFIAFVADKIRHKSAQEFPFFSEFGDVSYENDRYGDLLSFCRRGLEDGIKANWNETDETVWFGQGHARREVVIDIGSLDEERNRVVAAIDESHHVLRRIFGERQFLGREDRDFPDDIVI